MEKGLRYVSPEYQARLDVLAENLAADRRQRLADAALQDTVEMPIAIQDALFDYDNLVRSEE